jgi:hypothetical protein
MEMLCWNPAGQISRHDWRKLDSITAINNGSNYHGLGNSSRGRRRRCNNKPQARASRRNGRQVALKTAIKSMMTR